jgi:hypothetical protein
MIAWRMVILTVPQLGPFATGTVHVFERLVWNDFVALQGLPTIRAYGAESTFQASFIDHLSLNGSWWFAYLASSRWIGFRLDLIATVTLTLAVLLATAVRQQVRLSELPVGNFC